MLKPISAALALATLAFSNAGPAPALAGIEYPWCAQYSENTGGGGTNCGFTTIAQCRATISGVGGICYENPAYPAAAVSKPVGQPAPRR